MRSVVFSCLWLLIGATMLASEGNGPVVVVQPNSNAIISTVMTMFYTSTPKKIKKNVSFDDGMITHVIHEELPDHVTQQPSDSCFLHDDTSNHDHGTKTPSDSCFLCMKKSTSLASMYKPHGTKTPSEGVELLIVEEPSDNDDILSGWSLLIHPTKTPSEHAKTPFEHGTNPPSPEKKNKKIVIGKFRSSQDLTGMIDDNGSPLSSYQQGRDWAEGSLRS